MSQTDSKYTSDQASADGARLLGAEGEARPYTHEELQDMVLAGMGGSLFKAGYLREGFRAWETRFLDPGYLEREGIPRQGRWPLDVPPWAGPEEPLDGKTVLLWTEQGYGDAIQFIRYAPMVADLGARVIVGCQPELQRLFRTVKGVDAVYTLSELRQAHYDYHAPVLSLPYLFGTTVETIPATVPYVTAPAGASASLDAEGPLKVGLAWAGHPRQSEDARRSMPLRMMRPLLSLPGIDWYSLQVGAASAQINVLGLSGIVQDLSPRLHDFADTAAVIDQLDLVVTVDTSVAHLAGALGKPVWILLAHDADWRWMEYRLDSPWYPTARLFRQPWPGNWMSVIEDVREALTDLVQAIRPVNLEEACPSALVPQCASSGLQ